MKLNMIATKPGIAASYVVSGGTSTAGAAKIAQTKGEVPMLVEHVHSWLGFELSEWALMMGICGTIATMVFQYLNYRNNCKRNKKDNNDD